MEFQKQDKEDSKQQSLKNSNYNRTRLTIHSFAPAKNDVQDSKQQSIAKIVRGPQFTHLLLPYTSKILARLNITAQSPSHKNTCYQTCLRNMYADFTLQVVTEELNRSITKPKIRN